MIVFKTSRELELMTEACRLSAAALKIAGEAVRPGISTWEIDKIAYDYIISQGGKPNFLHYAGYPATACISVNDEVIHGIPSKHRILEEGDIVSIDLGAELHGYNGDNAATFAVGKISSEAQRLIDTTEQCLYKGIEAAVAGGRIGDIGHAIDSYVVENGMTTVKKYVGHGVGHDLHEDPNVPNYGTAGRGPRLCRGMTIAIEPMVNLGGPEVLERPDHWTVVTKDGSLSAHYEHSCALTPDGVILLTKVADI